MLMAHEHQSVECGGYQMYPEVPLHIQVPMTIPQLHISKNCLRKMVSMFADLGGMAFLVEWQE